MHIAAAQPNEKSTTDWTEALRARGLRATQGAIRVLAELELAALALSHDDIEARLISSLHSSAPDRVTLYRILDRLCESGLVKQVAGIDRARRYTLEDQTSNGLFECDSCHALTPLSQDPEIAKALELINQRLSAKGLASIETSVSAHGTCASCAPAS